MGIEDMAGFVVFLAVSCMAAVGATLAGFGSSTLLVPVGVHFFDIRMAIFLVACFHLFNNVFKVRVFRKKINIRTAALFGVPSILFAFFGASLIIVIPVETVKKILGVFLVVYALSSLLKPKFTLREHGMGAVAGGSLSGFLAGLIGLGGAIRSSFLIAFNLPKEVYVATSAVIALVIDLTRIPTYIFTGAVKPGPELYLIPFLVASAYLGVRTGKRLLNRIDHLTFRRIVAAALFLVGLKILV